MNALGHAPWIMGFVHKMAAVPEGPRRLLNLASERYDMRKEQGPTKDIFHYIVRLFLLAQLIYTGIGF